MPALGYGGAGAFTTISGLIAEFGPERLVITTNSNSPLLESGALEKVEQQGEELTVTVDSGESESATYISDFALRPGGNTNLIAKARFVPTAVTARLQLGKMAALAKLATEDMVELVDAKIQTLATSVARQIGRGLYQGTISPQSAVPVWTGTGSGSTVTIPFTDVGIFKPNAGYDFVDTSAALSFTVRCLTVAPVAVGGNSAQIAGNVTFINDIVNPTTGAVVALSATAIATNDIFALRGTFPGFGGSATAIVGRALNSFDDIAGAGAGLAFGGLNPNTVPGWIGQNLAAAGPISQELVIQFAARLVQYAGEDFTHALMSPAVAANWAIMAGNQGAVFGMTIQPTAQRPMNLTGASDKFGHLMGSGLTCAGRPVIQDPNCPQTAIVLHNQRHAKLGVWQEMEPEVTDETGGIVRNDPDRFGVFSDFSGMYQLYTAKRQAIGMITGITGG